jgi:energy-converting hydrogenase Eha subunit E
VSDLTYNIIGFVGAVLILLGFYRTSIGKWKNKSFIYELDNLVGASLLIFYQFHLRAFISVTVNIIWAAVAFRGLIPFAERYSWGKPTKKRSRS